MKAICSGYETAHLVMDDVEKLRSFHKNFLNSLLKLPESMNLCIILIGRKDWDSSMAHLCPGAMPFHVYFSSYNKEELLKIIMKDFVAENQVT
jgi:Cdc6-like AAA superfamily ATPase